MLFNRYTVKKVDIIWTFFIQDKYLDVFLVMEPFPIDSLANKVQQMKGLWEILPECSVGAVIDLNTNVLVDVEEMLHDIADAFDMTKPNSQGLRMSNKVRRTLLHGAVFCLGFAVEIQLCR